MRVIRFDFLLFSVLAIGSVGARAQAGAAPIALGLQVDFRSPLAEYRAFKDEPVADWRKANDLAGEIGGWRAYAREARRQGPESGPSSTAPSVGGANDKPAGVSADPASGHSDRHGAGQ